MNWFKKGEEGGFNLEYIIYPNSRIYKIWFVILTSSVVYYSFIIPFLFTF